MADRTPRGRQMQHHRAAVFSAVVHHWARNGRAPTTKELCFATGLRSTETIHRHLRHLRVDGLVTWEQGRQGTLRPTVAVIAV